MDKVPTEAVEGTRLVAYLKLKGYKFTHVPNETGGSMEARRRAIRMKQQGTSKGFPDYIIVVKDKLVFIELKRIRGSRTSPEQLDWLVALNTTGAITAVCKGSQEAIELLESIK